MINTLEFTVLGLIYLKHNDKELTGCTQCNQIFANISIIQHGMTKIFLSKMQSSVVIRKHVFITIYIRLAVLRRKLNVWQSFKHKYLKI